MSTSPRQNADVSNLRLSVNPHVLKQPSPTVSHGALPVAVCGAAEGVVAPSPLTGPASHHSVACGDFDVNPPDSPRRAAQGPDGAGTPKAGIVFFKVF